MCLDKTLSRVKEDYRIDACLCHQAESDYAECPDHIRNLKTMVGYVRTHVTAIPRKDYSRLRIL
jgi:hypothetical protein